MIPQTIHKELFNIACKVSDATIDYIAEELSKYGLHVNRIANHDLAITFYAEGKNIICQVRIDRLGQVYEIVATKGEWTIFPARGDWSLIDRYLVQLSRLPSELSDAKYN